MMLIVLAGAFMAPAGASADAVATCLVRKIEGGIEAGPKLDLYWRFDAKDKGPVDYPSSYIVAPFLVAGEERIFDVAPGAKSIQFWVGNPTASRLDAKLLDITPVPSEENLFRVSVGEVIHGNVNLAYFGTCIVERLPTSVEVMWTAITSKERTSK
ncbi:MAG: hypothetical protein EOP94_01440 [Zymomonas sp.]|nr:MAG: hypothetical protein EOP94_01440 [Zymomonas sp.]